MFKLLLLRHGQSIWNLENKFTGWTDVDLSTQGVEEARKAGQLLQLKQTQRDCLFSKQSLWVFCLFSETAV